MHYKNGREAKAGDRIISLAAGGVPISGILHSVSGASECCNGRIAINTPNDPYVNIKDCLHVDDIAAATIPDSSVANAVAVKDAPTTAA